MHAFQATSVRMPPNRAKVPHPIVGRVPVAAAAEAAAAVVAFDMDPPKETSSKKGSMDNVHDVSVVR